MCGICGAIQIDGEPRPVLARAVLDRMTDAMTHRGPNDRGTYAAPGIALGARRLSIVDVEGGHQPVPNEDESVWAVQNGELYNHEAVRAELRSHRFRSRCDTDILPHLYEAEGKRVPERLRGKFALAIWDGRTRQALIARDRLGVKPLYYARHGDLLLFASELKSLLASGEIPLQLDYEAIDAYLTLGFVPGPRTPLAGVSKLPPGHRIVVAAGDVAVEPYWTYPLPAPVGGRRPSKSEYAERLLDSLEDAVRVRLMSDVPLGAMLSGGLDSSLIVALMARNMSEPVKTFSVGFADGGDSELADARLVASALGTDHHELELTVADAAVDLADLVWSMDEPLADLSSLGFLALSELAARHVTVALSGQGADELLGGYQKHRAAALAERWRRLPLALRRAGEGAALRAPSERVRRLGRTFAAPDATSRLMNMSGQLEPALRAQLYTGALAETNGRAAEDAVRNAIGGVEDRPLAATLYADARLALVDDMLHYFDRASMARSLEVRVPFLDHQLVELCAEIPSGLKVNGLTTKYLLKEAARGLIPDQIIDKRKIGFFHGSISGWFRAQTDGAIADYLFAPDARYQEILDRKTVERLVREHADGNGAEHGRLLLAILLLEVWLSRFLPRAVEVRDALEAVSTVA